MNNKKIRWGVIGSGGIARRRTIPEGIKAAKNAELAAVFDVNTDVNAEVAKEFATTPVESINALLAADIDAVYIASPANLHCQQTLDAAAAGKHILCEKPLGITVEEALQMIDACKAADVKLGTAFMMRFQSQHQEISKMVQTGMIGQPVYGRAQLSCWYPPIEGAWRQNPTQGGGGSLMDLGGHCIDLLEMIFGELKSVSCRINNTVHNYKSEDSAVVILTFKNGAMATVDAFFCIPDSSSKNVLEVYGSKGSILAKETIGQCDMGQVVAFLEDDSAEYNAQQLRGANEGIAISPNAKNTYEAEIEEFSQAIIDDRQPSNNAQIGLTSQKVLAACYESAKTGKTIEL